MISHPEQRLTHVSIPEQLLTYAASHAHRIDAGEETTREALALVGAAGLADVGAAPKHHGSLLQQATVIEQFAEKSLSIAFSLWCHRMCIEYLSFLGGPCAREWLPKFRAGEAVGSSAMAPAFRYAAGLGDLGLHISRDASGQLRLSGRLGWASNLFSDAIIFAAAKLTPDQADTVESATPVIVAVPLASEGIEIGPELELLALRGTASTSVQLHNVPLSDEQIMTRDFDAFLQRARPVLSVLQASFCFGLASESFRHAQPRLVGVNQVFETEVHQLADRLVKAKQDFIDILPRIDSENPPVPSELLPIRLEAGVLAKQLTTLETMLSGSQGFVTTSDVNRRYREATFIPLQAPSEAQLRWELMQGNNAS